jgi:serine/threonine-protein kinase HipA
MLLAVFLHEDRVGEISVVRDTIEFRLAESYRALPNDDLGLNLAKSKRFEGVTLASFTRLGDKARLDLNVSELVGDTVARIRSTWKELRESLPLTHLARDTIERHWSRVPVMAL